MTCPHCGKEVQDSPGTSPVIVVSKRDKARGLFAVLGSIPGAVLCFTSNDIAMGLTVIVAGVALASTVLRFVPDEEL